MNRDVQRFWRYVVKGPADTDCWLWTGAVGDDGYGRFWTSLPGGRQRTMRPQRFLWRELTGEDLPPDVLLLHRCDIPLCVHVELDPHLSHLRPGTWRDNQDDAVRRGRQHNRFTVERFATLPRAERARRASQLRDSVREHGWDPDRIAAALAGANQNTPTLF